MKQSTIDQLTHRQLLLVLTYAPAGLGHLRVTDALYHGLPETVNPVVLGSQDRSIQAIHRLTSVNPIGKAVFDWLQAGPLSSQATRLYRYSLRANNRDLYNEMTRLLTERLERPEKILVVCTHFGLAHKLAAIKEKLQKQEGVRMVLAVCVTDDTFQHIWYVDGADLLVVPSQYTKRKYAAYGEHLGGKPRIEVVPFPLDPRLGVKLDAAQMADKTRQLDAHSGEPIHVSIPISGAAVGTEYFSSLIALLRQKSDRFLFHIVCKDAPFTQAFLSQLAGKSWVDLRLGKHDRQVVDRYDVLMETQTISLEVTKPSEQTFKCLVGTQARGGVILLFTQPVGTQEYDNMDFLLRHSLVPTTETNAQLWNMAGDSARLDPALEARLLEESRTWRGVRIPNDPHEASNFIWWMLSSGEPTSSRHRPSRFHEEAGPGVFARMLAGNVDRIVKDEHSQILGSDGVAEFWDLATAS
jgi:hypothetical protein